jgi:ABC-type transport system involved in multi-copper enzyme maturation permease subunit
MFTAIWQKEIRGSLYTWKSMLWLVIASLLFSFTSYLLLTNQELSLLDQTEMMWLLGKIIIGVALLIVTIDASSIITTEFEKETVETLFLSPLSLNDFILGKLFASLTLWAAIFIVSIPYIIVASMGSNLISAFVIYTGILGTLGVTGLIFFIFGVSLLYRSTKNTLTTSLIILLALAVPALFSSTLKTNTVSQLFSTLNPVDNIFAALDNILVDYHIAAFQNWQFLLPLFLFCLATFAFMRFSMQRFKKQGVIGSGSS